MEVLTDQPGVQFYTGNFLDGTIHGKGGKVYERRSGFCLETQHFPDSPNHPAFPTTTLKPGERFHSTTIYKFGVE
jgi:aldose 1-epimerase